MTLKRGKIPRPFEITGIRELARDDLELLKVKRDPGVVQKLKDPHHNLARLIAAGVRPLAVAAQRAGYSYNRAFILTQDPSFQELIARYRADVHAEFLESVDDFTQLAVGNMLKAERMIAEKLEDAEEDSSIPMRDLIAIRSDSADRFGYGKKQTNLNVNVDFASQLEAARKRSSRTIETTGATTPSQRQLPDAASAPASVREERVLHSLAPPQPLRRRA